MAWRIAQSIVRGELDNRTPGRVTGRFWLLGRNGPVTLDLEGNGWPDVAGCLLQFENPKPAPGDQIDLHPRQAGVVGDITAARKVRVFDMPIDEFLSRTRAGEQVTTRWANSIYLEWFSDANGRVVIESADFQLTISEPVWRMTDEQTRQQGEANRDAMERWMQRLGEAVAAQPSHSEDDQSVVDDGQPMDEFAWEKFLKESDARTDKYMELIEKYGDSPEAEIKIAREMGWDAVADFVEAERRGEIPEPDKTEDEEVPSRQPNPLTEGVDWVRDNSGHIHHPLQLKMFNVAMDMWHDCEKLGLCGETGDPHLHDMIFQAQRTGAKLAGALNSLAYDHPPEPGFIVASLKRALNYINASLASVDSVVAKNLLPADRLERFRVDLHEIRQSILDLMEHYRDQQA